MTTEQLHVELNRAARATSTSVSGLYEAFLGFETETGISWGRCYTFSTIEELVSFCDTASDCCDAMHVRYPASMVDRSRKLWQLRHDRENAAAAADASTPF